FHARGEMLADALDHAPAQAAILEGVRGDLHDHDHAVDGLALVVGMHHHVLAEARIVGDHEADPALLDETPHDVPLTLLAQGDHRALVAAAVIDVANPRQHLVAMKDALHLSGRQVKVGPFTGAGHEPETVAVADDATGHHVHVIGEREAVAAIADDGSGGDHL